MAGTVLQTAAEPPAPRPRRCGRMAGVTAKPAKPAIPNVLAQRYASPAMATLFSPEHKVVLERQLWLAVLTAQQDLGISTPDGAVAAYRKVVEAGADAVDL